MGTDRAAVAAKRTARRPVARPPRGGDRRPVEAAYGAPWRDLPERYGPWQTCYDRFSRWRRDGTWDRLLADAQTKSDAVGEVEWLRRRRLAARGGRLDAGDRGAFQRAAPTHTGRGGPPLLPQQV